MSEYLKREDVRRAALHYTGDALIAKLDELPTVQVPEWIPVTERLPENGIEVSVFTYTALTRVWTLADCKIWEDEYGYLHDFEAVTHWMQLPQPPEGR